MIPALLLGALLVGQNLDEAPVKAKQYVAYAAEAQTVAAGKRAVLQLRFQVLPGFHVNSHVPKGDLLIPTVVELSDVSGVKLGKAEYPAGIAFSFPIDPTEKLDVYEGGFTVSVPVTAATGEHELHGSLKYQACNKAACYPPRSLPVDVLFLAK